MEKSSQVSLDEVNRRLETHPRFNEFDSEHQLEKKTNFKVVFSMSAVRDLIPLTLKSIRNLSKFIDSSKIDVIFTPPWEDNHDVKELEKYANITYMKNSTQPFQLYDGCMGRYGEKIAAIYSINAEDIIFLDSDTKVLENPIQLLEGDFEISARIASGFNDLDINKWTSIFLKHGKTPIPMMNAGVLVFKNGVHKKIMKDALRYFLNEDFPKCHHNYFHKDQYAITLAASGHKIKWMTRNEHAYRWLNEYPHAIILHGEKKPFRIQLRSMIREIKKYVAL